MECRADQIYLLALELPEAGRARFVSEACVGDPDLRREVEQLLKDAVRADKFFGEIHVGDLPEGDSSTGDGETPEAGPA